MFIQMVRIQKKDSFGVRLCLSVLGTFCSHLLSNASRWKQNRETTLEDLMKLIAKLLDEPDLDYAISYGKHR